MGGPYTSRMSDIPVRVDDAPTVALDAQFASATAWLGQSQAMMALDRDLVITACNVGVQLVLGHEPAQLLGRPLARLFDGEPLAGNLLERLTTAARGGPARESGWMQRRDGLRMWAEVTSVPDLDPQGAALRYCLSIRDATLEYRASRALRVQADAAAARAASRNLFIGSVAHELRAALAPISTAAAIMERQAPDPAMQQKLAGIVRRNAASAARLVEDLLEFSTLSARKLALRPTLVDLHRVIVDCADAARPLATAAGLQLDLELRADDSRLQADADRIRQVVTNLLGNAVKFTPAGGRVVVRTSGTATEFTIEVADTGAGIEPGLLPFIFDPFEQGGGEVTSRYGGFGLGLAISAEIASMHRGELLAHSAGAGRGSTFRLVLPREIAAAPGPGRQEGRQTRPLHVLHVEDNADAADAMRYALGTLGWSMTHAASCADARRLVAADAGRFDVVLADLGLPDGSGVDLGAEFSPLLPVVAITAYGAPFSIDGFTEQLIKPAAISEVQRALTTAVARFHKEFA